MDGMRRIRTAFLLFVALLAAGILGLEALNRTVLPAKARRWAEESATQALGRNVSIGSVRLSLWRGFLLERVSIAEDPRFGTGPFLEAEQISGGILFLPLLGKQEILIPVLHLVRPRVRLLQNPNGEWNFKGLIPKKPAAPSSGTRFHLSIPKVLLTEGSCEFSSVRIEKINADLHLSLPAQIRGTLSAEILTGVAEPYQPAGRISLDGRYSFQEHRLELTGDSDWQIPSLLPFLPPKALARIERLDGSVSVKWELSGNPRGPLKILGETRTKGLQWNAFHIEGSGDLSAQFDAQFDAQGIRAERITLRLPNGTPVSLSGSVANDENRSFGFRAAAAFPADQPPPLPEKWMRTVQNLGKLSGQVSLEAVGNGSLLPQFTLRPVVTAKLEEIALQPPRSPRVEIRSGQIRWQPELVTFTGLEGTAMDQPFRLEGTLANWEQPEMNASFSWGKLDGEAQISLASEKISVESFAGRFGKGSFRLFGEIARPEPEANLYGEATFRVEDLGEVWPAAQQWLKLHPASGEISSRWLLQGLLNRPGSWDLDLHAGSPSLQIQGVPLEGVSAHLRQNEGIVTLHSAQAGLAGGTLSATGSLDRNLAPARWKASLNAAGVQLSGLARALRWKTQEELMGEARLDWSGEGDWGDPKKIAGSGNLLVAGGQILELPLMGKFADFLGLPTLRTIRFQEAQGPFRVKEGRVESDSFLLRSPQAALAISGWGGFLNGAESPIQWKILPTFAPELIPEQSRARLGRAIAQGASYFVGEVQLSGTWKEPKSKFVPKKLTQVLNEQIFNLQDLLQDLF